MSMNGIGTYLPDLPQTGLHTDERFARALDTEPRAFRDWCKSHGVRLYPVGRRSTALAEAVIQAILGQFDEQPKAPDKTKGKRRR